MSKELEFSSEAEAMQYLANITGKQIKIAKFSGNSWESFINSVNNEIDKQTKGILSEPELYARIDGENYFIKGHKNKFAKIRDVVGDFIYVSLDVDKLPENIRKSNGLKVEIRVKPNASGIKEAADFIVAASKVLTDKEIKTAGVGYELYAKGADRIAVQTVEIKKLAEKVAKATRENKSLRTRNKYIRDLEKMLNVSMGELKQLKSDANNLEGYKTASDKKPVALTVFGQLLVNKLWEEIESDEPGKLTQANAAPIGLMAVDQPLIESLWKKSREKHNL